VIGGCSNASASSIGKIWQNKSKSMHTSTEAYRPDVMKVEGLKSGKTIQGMHIMSPSEDDADSFYHKCIVHF
jgi:hypothetical protein